MKNYCYNIITASKCGIKEYPQSQMKKLNVKVVKSMLFALTNFWIFRTEKEIYPLPEYLYELNDNFKFPAEEKDYIPIVHHIAVKNNKVTNSWDEAWINNDEISISEEWSANKNMDNDNAEYRIFIDATDFQKHVLDYIGSDNFTKMISNTVYDGKQDCVSAVIHGMCIASMLTSECEHFYVTEKTQN